MSTDFPNARAKEIIQREKMKFIQKVDMKDYIIESLRRKIEKKNDRIEYLQQRLRSGTR